MIRTQHHFSTSTPVMVTMMITIIASVYMLYTGVIQSIHKKRKCLKRKVFCHSQGVPRSPKASFMGQLLRTSTLGGCPEIIRRKNRFRKNLNNVLRSESYI
ncbi:hypothetical protein BDZ94DRAFT_1257593 [Collybia nuda]|uniref:Uncharacterized protein n=1 Tax=Collybia nuda TaxID=64659 RepID=A0A9P6CFE1_9AGAR|nr:hypothetical protein BDZ94DRAFT_1257593 [Collybia nuda]